PWFLTFAAPKKYKDISPITIDSTLTELISAAKQLQQKVNEAPDNTDMENEWVRSFRAAIDETIRLAEDRLTTVETLAIECDELANVEWDFLYDKTSNLFTIGYNVQSHHADASFYDLLASE